MTTTQTLTARQVLDLAKQLREESFADCARIDRHLNSTGLSERLYKEAIDSALRLDSRFELGVGITHTSGISALADVVVAAREVLA